METKFQTSFIPKKPLAPTGSSSSRGMGLFLLISIVVLLISFGFAGYVWLSKETLKSSIKTSLTSIEDNKNGVISDPNTVENLAILSSRIAVAKNLLAKHVSISPVFDFLQQTTLRSVRFKNFNFTSGGKDSKGVNTVSIQLAGQARDWETVALQADEFGKQEWKKIINEPKISNLNLNADGSISFTFTARIALGSLVYSVNNQQNN